MKILQVAPAYFPAISIGGPIQSSLALATLLQKTHRVTALTTPLGLSAEEAAGVTYDETQKAPFGGELIYKRFYGYPHFTFSPDSHTWLRSHVCEYDLAILHGVWNFPILSAARACQKNGVPYLVFPHGTLYQETVSMKSGFKKRLFLKLFVNRLLTRASSVVFTTHDEAEKVTAFLGLPLATAVIPNIVRDNAYDRLPSRGLLRNRLGIGPDVALLLHLGRVAPKKNLPATLQVLHRLRMAGRPVELIVAGGDDDGERPQLEAIARDLGITDAVHFTGLLSRDAIREVLADADVFMLPSLSENFGIAVVEAMLARVPIVISDGVGIGREIGAADAGVVMPLAAGVDGLTDAVARLLDNPQERQRLAHAGREFALREYAEESVADRVRAVVQQATNPGGG
jgi:glycosyltransferase involved in cell wall biosynthesis